MQFILTMMFLLNSYHDAVGCEELNWDGTDEVYLSDNEDVLNLVRDIKVIAGVEIPIVVCESYVSGKEYVPLAASQTHNDSDGMVRGYVHIPQEVSYQFSKIALKGLIAHEIAHIVLPRIKDCTMMRFRLDTVTQEERAGCETPADSRAVEWTDADVVRSFLLEVGALLSPYAKTEKDRIGMQRRLIIRYKELEGR